MATWAIRVLVSDHKRAFRGQFLNLMKTTWARVQDKKEFIQSVVASFTEAETLNDTLYLIADGYPCPEDMEPVRAYLLRSIGGRSPSINFTVKDGLRYSVQKQIDTMLANTREIYTGTTEQVVTMAHAPRCLQTISVTLATLDLWARDNTQETGHMVSRSLALRRELLMEVAQTQTFYATVFAQVHEQLMQVMKQKIEAEMTLAVGGVHLLMDRADAVLRHMAILIMEEVTAAMLAGRNQPRVILREIMEMCKYISRAVRQTHRYALGLGAYRVLCPQEMREMHRRRPHVSTLDDPYYHHDTSMGAMSTQDEENPGPAGEEDSREEGPEDPPRVPSVHRMMTRSRSRRAAPSRSRARSRSPLRDSAQD
ncbi:t123 [Tupaiid betaherpesvirus 1]|uniref:T123 n=1 Tax=Tupaiid herpesvirus 1 (strain 1) TaxID=10397 RepID=Q91TH3_TUHV1|nr:t123 [Tupaiid betaherpesvirus 1]AAK57174.1 t123 [Tupaiid betaherpesvirus 1]